MTTTYKLGPAFGAAFAQAAQWAAVGTDATAAQVVEHLAAAAAEDNNVPVLRDANGTPSFPSALLAFVIDPWARTLLAGKAPPPDAVQRIRPFLPEWVKHARGRR